MADRFWIGSDGTSPGDPNVAGNWSPATVPVNGDRQIFDSRATGNLKLNLAALSAINGSIVVENFTKRIGSDDGLTAYSTACTAIDVNANSDRMLFDTGAAAVTVNVRRTSTTAADAELMPFRIKGSSITLNVSGASKAGVAQRVGETATLTNLRLSSGSAGTPQVELGRGVTVTAQTINAGTCRSVSDNTATTTNIDGGIFNYEGTGALTTVNVYAESTFYHSGTGTITTLNVYGTLDGSRDGRSKTITTARFYRGSNINLDNGVNTSWTLTNAIEYPDGIGALVKYLTPPSVKGTLVNI